MGLTINRPGVDPYSSNLLKHKDETGRQVSGQRGESTPASAGKQDPSVRLSISGAAMQKLGGGNELPPGLENLSKEERKELKALTSELDDMLQKAGGFRQLTETQWERVDELFGRISHIHGMAEEDKPRIAELRAVYELEAELNDIYGADSDKVLSDEEEDRVEEIMAELEQLWGDGEQAVVLNGKEEKQLARIEAELEKYGDKIDSWTLTPEDEERVDALFSAVDRLFDRAEQRMLRHEPEGPKAEPV